MARKKTTGGNGKAASNATNGKVDVDSIRHRRTSG